MMTPREVERARQDIADARDAMRHAIATDARLQNICNEDEPDASAVDLLGDKLIDAVAAASVAVAVARLARRRLLTAGLPLHKVAA